MPDDNAMDTLKFGIGQPVPRTEDPRLLTGGGRYTDDYDAPGQAWAVFVRSTVAHGDIGGIDISAAAASPGVLGVFTGIDLRAEGVKDLPCTVPVKNRDGSPMFIPPYPALAVGRVRYVGDPLAVVIAETEAQAREAAELVVAEIDPLPATIGPAAAVGQDAPQIWDGAPDNICLDFLLGDEKAADEAFAKAAHITRLRVDNTRMVVNAMEPRAAVAEYDAEAGKFTLHVPSQGVWGFHNAMARIMGVKPEQVRVITGDVGGSFGMKSMAYREPVALLFAARALGRPVKWRADRSESFVADHHGRASDLTAELALDEDGTFLGLRVTGYGDVGAYLQAFGPLPHTAVISRNMVSVYKTPAFAYNVKCVFTNTVPTGPYRGAGRPESKYVLEQLVDQAARETGIDRIELRRRNLIPPSAMPYKAPNGVTYDTGEFEAIMDAAMARADWDGFPARRAQSEAAGRLRGLGLAIYTENTGSGGTELADIRFNTDGTVDLITGARDIGTGHAAPFAQVLHERLGVPFEAIRLVEDDSDRMSEAAGGSGGSKSAACVSGAIVECSDAIVENGRKAAGHVLEAAAEDIEFSAGRFTVAGTDRSIGIMELAEMLRGRNDLPEGVPQSLDHRTAHEVSPSTWPNGCHVCEVEIDPETGETEVLRYTVVDDFGTMLNPLIVEGQVHGGVAQGLGQVLMEKTVYDADGQLISGSYMDYAMPKAADVCSIDFATRPVPCTTNPLGVKGAGEAGNGGSMPAVMNAVIDALAARGITRLDAPTTPHAIWQALRAAEGN